MMRTEHIYSACKYQVSMKWFNTLKKDHQDSSSRPGGCRQVRNEMAVAADKDYTAKLSERRQDDHGRGGQSAFAKAVEPAMDKLDKEVFEPGLLKKVRDIK